MDRISDILPEEERKRLLQEHEDDKVRRLLEMRRELIRDLTDVEVALADKAGCMGDAVIYVGCHTRQRTEEGSPKFKMEVTMGVGCYKDATLIVRGLKDTADRLIRLPEKIKKEVEGGTTRRRYE